MHVPGLNSPTPPDSHGKQELLSSPLSKKRKLRQTEHECPSPVDRSRGAWIQAPSLSPHAQLPSLSPYNEGAQERGQRAPQAQMAQTALQGPNSGPPRRDQQSRLSQGMWLPEKGAPSPHGAGPQEGVTRPLVPRGRQQLSPPRLSRPAGLEARCCLFLHTQPSLRP